MDYTLRELECFLAVAEELSFTRAARRLHLAQPPLSRHIRTLEEKIGTALFLREPRRISLTAAGALFYDEVHTLPKALIRAGEAARRCGLGETTRLRLGFVSAVMNDELVGVFRSFREAHPEVQIMLHDLSPHEQIRAILDGNLDGGFIGLPPLERAEGLELLAWRREPLLCFVPKGHPLADRGTIALADLAGESFIAVSRESAPAFALHLRELCREAGFRPRIILESPRAQAVALMVAAGSGIALLPAALTRSIGTSATTLPLQEAPEITHVFALRQGNHPPPLHLLRGQLLKLDVKFQRRVAGTRILSPKKAAQLKICDFCRWGEKSFVESRKPVHQRHVRSQNRAQRPSSEENPLPALLLISNRRFCRAAMR